MSTENASQSCLPCLVDPAEKQARAKSRDIDHALSRAQLLEKKEIKMLLLGPGESGKSTIFKQMKLIHSSGFDENDRRNFRIVIIRNVIQSMLAIIAAMDRYQIPLSDPTNERHRDTLKATNVEQAPESLSAEVTAAVKALWKDAGVRACYARRSEYDLQDSCSYFFDDVGRIAAPNYTPTDQDILRARVRTTGITSSTFAVGDLTYHMYDVGGQRSERRKWLHCFENVTAVVFMVALSEYDQVLAEDSTVNRMQEAIKLFDSICNSRWFVRTSIILFLNKIDLFEQKLTKVPLQSYFPEYTGGSSFKAGCEFMTRRFRALRRASNKPVYVHLTCATDTEQIKFVMDAVYDILVQKELDTLNIL
ncbi:guanine nucleotide-binding protein subunit alpha [Geranomyces variabilis]|uniref:Guanine nucleotide-binding protein subunit alpha n=1 Tax=Geranomyces variabilis TaxID=109894 RepID=A0AAD5TMA3_9FUNG|nr:guanine nucleotide-binding protein subunit alpha [Geranomyces variabilis]